MKAIRYERYGGPEVLQLADVAAPVPKPHQVLIRTHASSINAADYRLMRANPFLARFAAGLFAPTKTPILGSDVAGVVEAIGAAVTQWKPGDRVFGSCFSGMGAWAERVCVDETSLVAIPDGLSFEAAAALSLAGITALHAAAAVRPGERVLVQGAGGGVGMLLVQVCKALGAHMTAVCSAETAALIAADRVIDYTRADFTTEDVRYDVIFGVNGYRSLAEYKRALAPNGRYVMVGGDNAQLFDALLFARLRFVGSGKTATVTQIPPGSEQADLRRLLALNVRAHVAKTFPLAEAADAVRYVEAGKAKGKVVLRCA